jgi:hypothetical protein
MSHSLVGIKPEGAYVSINVANVAEVPGTVSVFKYGNSRALNVM